MSDRRKRALSVTQMEGVARLFNVLSVPPRLALLHALHERPLSVNELVAACKLKQANVSKHLAVLHGQGLLKRQRNGISIRYEIGDPMVFALCDLVCGKMERDAKRGGEGCG